MVLDNQTILILFSILLGLTIINTLMIVCMVAIVSSSRVGKFLTMFVLGGPVGIPEHPPSSLHKSGMGFKTDSVHTDDQE